jgi:hypothetical protein
MFLDLFGQLEKRITAFTLLYCDLNFPIQIPQYDKLDVTVISYTGDPTHDNDFVVYSHREGYLFGIVSSSPISKIFFLQQFDQLCRVY